MSHLIVACPKCASRYEPGIAGYIPGGRVSPQFNCPSCGTGLFLSLRFRLKLFIFSYLYAVGAASLIALLMKGGHLYPPSSGFSGTIFLCYFSVPLLLGIFLWVVVIRRFGQWQEWGHH